MTRQDFFDNTILGRKVTSLNFPFYLICDPNNLIEREILEFARILNAELITINNQHDVTKAERNIEKIRQKLGRSIIRIPTKFDLPPYHFVSIRQQTDTIEISKADFFFQRLGLKEDPVFLISDQFIDDLNLLNVDINYWQELIRLNPNYENISLILARFLIFIASGMVNRVDVVSIGGVMDSLLTLREIKLKAKYTKETREFISSITRYYMINIDLSILQENERNFISSAIYSFETKDEDFLEREIVYQVLKPLESIDDFLIKEAFKFWNWHIEELLKIEIPDERLEEKHFIWKYFEKSMNVISHLIMNNITVLQCLKNVEKAKLLSEDNFLSSLNHLLGLTKEELDIVEKTSLECAFSQSNKEIGARVLEETISRISKVFKFCLAIKAIEETIIRLKNSQKLMRINAYLETSDPISWGDWCQLYEEKIIEGDWAADILSHYQQSEPNPTIQTLLKAYYDLKEKLMIKFENFFLKYTRITISDNRENEKTTAAVPNMIKEILAKNRIPVLLVIDGMNLGVFFTLKEMLLERGFVTGGKRRRVASFIPSITHISRWSLFSGKKQIDLIELSKSKKIAMGDEPKLLAHACGLSSSEIAYTRHLEDFKKCLEEVYKGKRKVAALIYRFVDKFSHGFEDDPKVQVDSLKPVFSSLLDIHMKSILANKDTSLIVTADHGCVKTSVSPHFSHLINKIKKETFNLEKRFLIEGRSRYFYIAFNSYPNLHKLTPFEKIAILTAKLGNDFILIPPNELYQYGLSKYQKFDGKLNKVDLLVFIPQNFSLYTQDIGKKLHHGGLTFYETIVPLEVFEQSIEELKELNLFPLIDLWSFEKSVVKINIMNPNSIPAFDLELIIEGFGKTKIFNFPKIKKNDIISTPLSVGPFEKGSRPITITLNYKLVGNPQTIKVNKEAIVSPGRKERLKIDRSLPEDW